jgi:hypothetical protein
LSLRIEAGGELGDVEEPVRADLDVDDRRQAGGRVALGAVGVDAHDLGRAGGKGKPPRKPT